MRLSEKNIQDFQEICKSMGYELSSQEAITQGMALLSLLETINKPMTEAQYDAVQEYRKGIIHLMFKD
jgi:hypothetical protein